MCALPIVAQNIPAGDDLWSSVGGGSSYVTLTDADWFALCGVHPGNVTVNMKGQALSGMGNGDTIVTRLDAASLPTVPSSATVRIQLKSLSMVNDGSHPCSPYTLTVTDTAAHISTGLDGVNTNSHATKIVVSDSGSNAVSVERREQGLVGTIETLHKSNGTAIGWILLADSFAGSMILLSLTGVILWTGLNRRRTVGASIFIVSIMAIIAFAAQSV